MRGAWLTPWKKHRVPFVGTQLILFSHDFYATHLQTQYDRMAESRHWMESFFYQELSQLPAERRPCFSLLRFRAALTPQDSPRIAAAPTRTPAQRLTNLFRATMRRLTPGWWL